MARTSRIAGLFAWFAAWWGTARKVSALDRKIARLAAERERAERRIERHRRDLDRLHNTVTQRIEKASRTLEQAKAINKRLEIALEAAGEELKTRDEILIPGLLAADRALVSRWETEAAIQSMRQATLGLEANEE